MHPNECDRSKDFRIEIWTTETYTYKPLLEGSSDEIEQRYYLEVATNNGRYRMLRMFCSCGEVQQEAILGPGQDR